MSRRGGARSGAGRKSLKKKDKDLHVKVSQEAYTIFDWYSMKIGISKSDLIELWIEDNCQESKRKGVV